MRRTFKIRQDRRVWLVDFVGGDPYKVYSKCWVKEPMKFRGFRAEKRRRKFRRKKSGTASTLRSWFPDLGISVSHHGAISEHSALKVVFETKF
uniref:Uncharacterized protein n=1 Tax=Solanum tuberosum TaxID=4113 RepID=M1C1I5_SOLTU